MSNPQCPDHGECKVVPAGFSQRTNKPYDAFYSCVERNCNFKPKEKPAKEQPQPAADDFFPPTPPFETSSNSVSQPVTVNKDNKQDSITRAVALKTAAQFLAGAGASRQDLFSLADDCIEYLNK